MENKFRAINPQAGDYWLVNLHRGLATYVLYVINVGPSDCLTDWWCPSSDIGEPSQLAQEGANHNYPKFTMTKDGFKISKDQAATLVHIWGCGNKSRYDPRR